MAGILNASNLSSLIMQRTLGMPDGGPRILPIRLDFGANASWLLDYSNSQALSYFDMVQTLWVDNFGNGSILKVTVPSSQQVLQIPAGIQGYFTVLCPNPIKLQFDSAGGTVQQVTLLNFPVLG